MKKHVILLVCVLCYINSHAQVYGEIGLYKAYFFELGQDLSLPLSQCKYSHLKQGTKVEIIDVDTMDIFHVKVKYKKKTGIIHTGVLANRSILIPYFPQVREKHINNIKNKTLAVGMNTTEVGLVIHLSPQKQNHKNILEESYENTHPLYGHPNVSRWYYSTSSFKDIYFYKGKLCKSENNPQIGYFTMFDIQLVNVERIVNAKKANCNIEIARAEEGINKKYTYEDEYMKIDWIPLVDCFGFSVQNKSLHAIKLPWDEMAFIDLNNESKRILNGETRKINSDREQPNSVIPRTAKLSGFAVPYPQEKFVDVSYFCPQELADEGCSYLGKKISVLFPIIIQDITYEYIFEFEIKDVFVLPKLE